MPLREREKERERGGRTEKCNKKIEKRINE